MNKHYTQSTYKREFQQTAKKLQFVWKMLLAAYEHSFCYWIIILLQNSLVEHFTLNVYNIVIN